MEGGNIVIFLTFVIAIMHQRAMHNSRESIVLEILQTENVKFQQLWTFGGYKFARTHTHTLYYNNIRLREVPQFYQISELKMLFQQRAAATK